MTRYATSFDVNCPTETNALDIPGHIYHDGMSQAPYVDLATPGLKVERLRLLGDERRRWWNVSYCYGRLNGQRVNVSIPFEDELLDCHLRAIKRTIVEWGIANNVYVKRTGILDAISTLY